MKGLFIPEITTEMFRNGCLESIESLMAEGEIYDIDYPLEQETILDKIKRDIFNACSDNYHMPVYKLDCDKIFEIIDKYKAEQEASNERRELRTV